MEPEKDPEARLRVETGAAAAKEADKMLVILGLFASFLSILYLTAPSIRFVLIRQLSNTLQSPAVVAACDC